MQRVVHSQNICGHRHPKLLSLPFPLPPPLVLESTRQTWKLAQPHPSAPTRAVTLGPGQAGGRQASGRAARRPSATAGHGAGLQHTADSTRTRSLLGSHRSALWNKSSHALWRRLWRRASQASRPCLWCDWCDWITSTFRSKLCGGASWGGVLLVRNTITMWAISACVRRRRDMRISEGSVSLRLADGQPLTYRDLSRAEWALSRWGRVGCRQGLML